MSWRAEPLARPAPLAEGWLAEWVRTAAFAHRNLIMAKRNVFFVFELTFWPGVAMLSHGLLTRFLDLTPEMTAFVLVGTVARLGPCRLDAQRDHLAREERGDRLDRGVIEGERGRERLAHAGLQAVAQLDRHERVHAEVAQAML